MSSQGFRDGRLVSSCFAWPRRMTTTRPPAAASPSDGAETAQRLTLAVVDLEATGTDVFRDRMTQIACIVLADEVVVAPPPSASAPPPSSTSSSPVPSAPAEQALKGEETDECKFVELIYTTKRIS